VQLEPGMLGEQGQHVLLFASQRCPVGSHATVTPAKPALLGCPVQRQRQILRPTAERPPRQNLRIMVGDHHHLLGVSQIDPDDRVARRHQHAAE
jgi:hypothetical protein